MAVSIAQIPRILSELAAAPSVTLHKWGDVEAERTFSHFTRRHPCYKVIRNKTLYGVVDSNGVVKAYGDDPVWGDVMVSRLLGRGDGLYSRVMYFLLSVCGVIYRIVLELMGMYTPSPNGGESIHLQALRTGPNSNIRC